MLYWMCDKSQSPPTGRQLEHAIRRNFGGLDEQNFNSLDIFSRELPLVKKGPEIHSHTRLSEEVSKLSPRKSWLLNASRY